MFERDFRSVLWRSLGLTIALLFILWLVLEALVGAFLVPLLGPWPWLSTALAWLTGAGALIGAVFLIGPVTALFAGLFMDDVALAVESRHYPHEPPGTPLPVLPSMLIAAKFTAFVLLANFLALLLVLLPGINFAVFYFVNALLLGREFFEFAALRFRPEKEVRQLRRRHLPTIVISGLLIAAFMSVPLLNLLTPLFATALMVHVHKAIAPGQPLDTNPQSEEAAA